MTQTRFFAPKLALDASLQESALCVVRGANVPLLLDATERRKPRPFWLSDAEWSYAYNELSRQQWELLMDAKEDIIREIRAVRGSIPGGADTSLEAYPVGSYPGVEIADVVGSLNTNGRSAAAILVSIEEKIQAQGGNDEELLELIGQIALLLGV